MSKKYKDKLLAGSGVSNKSYESEFGLKMLQKMGWEKGNGLGKTQSGRKDCIQIKRREDGKGLGVQEQNDKTKFQWNNNWWDHSYNDAAKKMSINSQPETDESESENPYMTRQKVRKLSCSSINSNNTEIEGEILKARLKVENKIKNKSIKKQKKNQQKKD